LLIILLLIKFIIIKRDFAHDFIIPSYTSP